MNIFSAESLGNLGVGIAAIAAIVYIVITHSKERVLERKEFVSFVQTNNHKVTELVRESTTAIVASTKNIEESTRMIRRVCDILDKE